MQYIMLKEKKKALWEVFAEFFERNAHVVERSLGDFSGFGMVLALECPDLLNAEAFQEC